MQERKDPQPQEPVTPTAPTAPTAEPKDTTGQGIDEKKPAE